MQSWVKHYCCRVNEDVSLSPLWTCVAPVCQETKTNKMETAVAHLTEDFIFYLNFKLQNCQRNKWDSTLL